MRAISRYPNSWHCPLAEHTPRRVHGNAFVYLETSIAAWCFNYELITIATRVRRACACAQFARATSASSGELCLQLRSSLPTDASSLTATCHVALHMSPRGCERFRGGPSPKRRVLWLRCTLLGCSIARRCCLEDHR